jgi:chromosome segregation ATPase
MPKSGTITTGVDNLVQVVSQKKRLSIAEAAKYLEVPRELIEEWADFLEEKGAVKIEYKFTTPYLVLAEATEKQVSKNKKAFTTKKEAFLRQIDSTLGLIENHHSALERVRDEFDKINSELDTKIKSIRSELSELDRFDALKKDLGSELIGQYEHFKKRMESVESKIKKYHKDYDQIIENIESESEELSERYTKLEELKALEEKMKKNLSLVRATLREIETEEHKELDEIGKQQQVIDGLRHSAKRLESEVVKHRTQIKPLLKEFEQAEHDSAKAKDEVLAGLEEHLRSVEVKESTIDSIRSKFERYLKQKIDIDILMDRLTSETEKLSAELKMIKQEAKIISVTSKDSAHVEKEVAELEEKYKRAMDRKKSFEAEITRLTRLIKPESVDSNPPEESDEPAKTSSNKSPKRSSKRSTASKRSKKS